MDRFLRFHLLFLLCVFLCFRCASESLPGGGPPDREPPLLLHASILNGSTDVDSLQILEFHFSEPLNAAVAEKNITIFPLGAAETQVRVRGRSILIRPLRPWDPELVYTLILGRQIGDLGNNTLPGPLQFSFTRAGEIPQNRIYGRVYELGDDQTAAIRISRSRRNADSVLADPEYFTQSGADGYFEFQYLPRDSFYLAGYVDLDRSNSYEERLDGRLVPLSPSVLPDTGSAAMMEFLAIQDNFLPPRLILAESLYPSATRLEFTKAPDISSPMHAFECGGQRPDTVLTEGRICILYHAPAPGDSLDIRILGFKDYLQCAMPDSSLRIPVKALKDSLYKFEQKNNMLLIAPPPDSAVLYAEFLTETDTFDLLLNREARGFYRIPEQGGALRGKLRLKMPASAFYSGIVTDTLYSIDMTLPGPAETGAVLGNIRPAGAENCRMVLKGREMEYETPCRDGAFRFEAVPPGTYRLLYYIDRNGNGRRDFGRPEPHRAPEIPYLLDTDIGVRARWDTELREPYQIGVEN